MIRGGAIYAPYITSPKVSRLPWALLVPNSLAVGSLIKSRVASKRGEQTDFTTKSLSSKTIRLKKKMAPTTTFTVLTRNTSKFKLFHS